MLIGCPGSFLETGGILSGCPGSFLETGGILSGCPQGLDDRMAEMTFGRSIHSVHRVYNYDISTGALATVRVRNLT